MGDHLTISGRLIGHTTLDRRPMYYDPPDELYLFHQPATGFVVLTVARKERQDDSGTVTSADALVSTSTYASVEDLAAAMVDRYAESGWHEILAAVDHGADPDLYLRWVAWRIEADFNNASIHVKDLALATAFIAGDQVPAPGRAIDGWEAHYVRLMADQVAERGYEVLGETELDEPPEVNPFGDPVLGALRLRRYGHDAVGVVRVDDVGEVFIRLHQRDDTPAVTPAPDDDDW